MIKNAFLVFFGCLAFIAIFWFAFVDMENQIEKHYKSIISKVEYQKDSVKNILDSIEAENFRIGIELGRYEVAYEIFSRRNAKAAEQYAEIISSETE